MNINSKICSECGELLNGDNIRYFDDVVMCENCFESRTVTCDNCGERVWRDNAEGDSTYTLCSYCYEYNFVVCERCGRFVHNEEVLYEEGDDYPYCRDCFEKINDCPIKCYNYKPEPMFYGSGNLFMGVELEVDKGGEIFENARSILEVANKDNQRIYCKHDGSLSEGFEIVSHPMTLDYHINKMNWRDVFDKAISMDYRSHHTYTCGLHVHCSRAAFGCTTEEQEDVISRIVFFVEKHWNELLKFSRRTEASINRWASRYGISDNTKDTYKKAKDKRMGRYVAVNLENDSTIEFRIFRGTLRYDTFIATLQLVDEICNKAIRLTDKEMEALTWDNFVSEINVEKNPQLFEYLRTKELFVKIKEVG